MLAVSTTLVAAPAAQASVPKTKACVVKVSSSKPVQYSTVSVTVSQVPASVTVTTVAKYKTTNTKKTAKASTKGIAVTKYGISRATPNYRVNVTVTAQKGTQKYACSTSFVPQKKR